MIYTTGYTGKTYDELWQMIHKYEALLVDIRLNAISRVDQWRKYRLKAEFGRRYSHLPQLGNLLYRESRIKIASPSEGFKILKELHRECRNLILMCACKDRELCHRSTVASLILRRHITEEVVELAVKKGVVSEIVLTIDDFDCEVL